MNRINKNPPIYPVAPHYFGIPNTIYEKAKVKMLKGDFKNMTECIEWIDKMMILAGD